MSTSTEQTVPNPGAPARSRNLPAVVSFPGDEPVRAALTGLQQYLRLGFEDLIKGRESETVVITSQERTILEKAMHLRAPSVRVIALSDWRYSDPRTDSIVYAYLPVKTPAALVERTIDNAVDHIHLLASRRDVNERLAGATQEIQELAAIGAALAAEYDSSKILEMMLDHSRRLTSADAGALYLVEEAEEPGAKATPEQKPLRLKMAQSDSGNIRFPERVRDGDERSAVAYAAHTGKAVNIEDAYHMADGSPCQVSRESDEESGYRTQSILCVPIINQKSEILGVLQLINAKRRAGTKLTSVKVVAAEVVPFSLRQQAVATSLATQGAVALENSRLIRALRSRVKDR